VSDPTVIAIDWSGAKRTTTRSGIWLAEIRAGELVDSRPLATREAAVEHLLASEPPVVAGFDFSFGVPQWFATEQGCSTIDDVWALAARDGERWLAPTPPFWRTKCEVAPGRRFRRCELAHPRAKSVFQLVGNGQVGAGSVRGMPLLAELRAGGCAIWPFDGPAERTVVEIYPSFLRTLSSVDETAFTNEHERDAVCSARVMWDERASVAALKAATDPITRLEGDVWAPSSARRTTASP